jgi:signal transduction histidine kinase
MMEVFMSVRLRLTLLYTGLLALALTIFASIVYINMYRTLYGEIDQSVNSMANSVLKSVKITIAPFSLREIILPDVDVFSSPDTYIQVVDAEGRLVTHSRNLGVQLLPLSESTLASAARGKGFYETVKSSSRKLRIFNVPLILNGNLEGILQVGRTLQQVDEVLIRLKILILSGGLATVLIAGLLGLSMAKIAFRPLEKINATASTIQKGSDLGRRIEYTGPQDELGMLVVTINSMLERLDTAYRKLESANEVQRRFVADASHELRTPLTTIRGNAELLIKMQQDRPAGEIDALKDIVSEAERLTRLVSGLLALARADAGQGFDKSPAQLAGIMDDIARGARLLSEDVHFEYNGGAGLEDLTVNINTDLIKQVFFILIDNAFKYTPAGGKVTLTLDNKCRAPEGDAGNCMACITVSDTGPGIPEEDRKNIFSRFYRGDFARGTSGSGLGLAIAQWIVGQHGGIIEVSSTVGEGSCFTVYLPLSN